MDLDWRKVGLVLISAFFLHSLVVFVLSRSRSKNLNCSPEVLEGKFKVERKHDFSFVDSNHYYYRESISDRPRLIVEATSYQPISSRCHQLFHEIPIDTAKRHLDYSYEDVKDLKSDLKILLCFQFKNEAENLVEFIEFYRMQGVDLIVGYDDGSSDEPAKLAEMYQERGLKYFKYYPPMWMDFGRNFDARRQRRIQHCLKTYGKEFDWVFTCDIDEFIFSPKYFTLKNYFHQKNEVFTKDKITEVIVEDMRFGYGNLMIEPQNHFHHYNEGERRYKHYIKGDHYLVTQLLKRRQPSKYLGEPEMEMRDCLRDFCDRKTEVWQSWKLPACQIHPGKAIGRVRAIPLGGDKMQVYHFLGHEITNRIYGKVEHLSGHEDLRMHHYYSRSLETGIRKSGMRGKARTWGKRTDTSAMQMVRLFIWGNAFRSYVYDSTMDIYRDILKDRIERFRE